MKFYFSVNLQRLQTFFSSSRWRSLDLTYRVTKYPDPDLITREEVDEEVREAFKLWSDVTDLTFAKRGYGPVHIEISFERRSVEWGLPYKLILTW